MHVLKFFDGDNVPNVVHQLIVNPPSCPFGSIGWGGGGEGGEEWDLPESVCRLCETSMINVSSNLMKFENCKDILPFSFPFIPVTVWLRI